jgi:hypothetical protein
MAFKTPEFRAGERVPEPGCLVEAAGQHLAVVGREGDGVDGGGMPFKAAQLSASGRIP